MCLGVPARVGQDAWVREAHGSASLSTLSAHYCSSWLGLAVSQISCKRSRGMFPVGLSPSPLWLAEGNISCIQRACALQHFWYILWPQARFSSTKHAMIHLLCLWICSVCPPYLKVSYPEIFQLLESSALITPSTCIIVEYPKSHASLLPDQLGPLPLLRCRKYGRTYVATYAPAAAE